MSPMNPLIAEVLERQLRSLRRIYLVMGICVKRSQTHCPLT